MTDDRMTEAEWETRKASNEREQRFAQAAVEREERNQRKAHEQTDLTDEELAKAARHHQDIEQWSCRSCWDGHTCDVGRLIREVQRRRAEDS